ncbi:MAG: M48 family metallopeptidase [Rhizobiaceae bacterium]
MPQAVEGRWRPPGAARGVEARLWVDTDRVAILCEAAGGRRIAEVVASALVTSDRLGSIPRRIDFPDGSQFETGDNDGVDRILGITSRIASLERFHPRLAVIVGAVFALAYAIYRFALPVMVEVAIAVTPPVVPQLISQSVFRSLDGVVFAPTELPLERQKAISDGFDAMSALTARGSVAASSGQSAYTLNFRKGEAIGANAFALPDGTIVLTDELVELAQDDEMVLGVLAHEIGHVDHDHSLRQLYRAAGVTALIMLVAGDIGAGTEDILVQGAGLLTLSHTRTAEREADRFSVELMYEAGRDPAAIARFFELLRDRFGDTSENDFLSTHPATPERIEDTKRYAEEVAGAP